MTASGRPCRVTDDDRPAGRRRTLLLVVSVAALAAAGIGAAGWAALHVPAPDPVVVLPGPPTPVDAESPADAPADRVDGVPAAELKSRGTSPLLLARTKPNYAPPDATAERAPVTTTAAPLMAVAEQPTAATKHVGRVYATLQPPARVPLHSPDADAAAKDDLSALPELVLAPLPVRKSGMPVEGAEVKKWLAEQKRAIQEKNGKEPDGFIKSLAAERADLAGLPFLLSKACQLPPEAARQRVEASRLIRRALGAVTPDPSEKGTKAGVPDPSIGARFWQTLVSPERSIRYRETRTEGALLQGLLPSLMQILATEPPALRVVVVKQCRDLEGPDVTTALARLALYDADPAVREEALYAVRERPPAEATEVLVEGLRYPWPVVAERAANALVFLKRTDLIVPLRELASGPDPCAPFVVEAKGQRSVAVRELVKVNHHRSCLLCHAPSADQQSRDVPQGLVPSPVEPLPPMGSVAYYANSRPGDILVRADVTYLRQDFSALLPVENAAPWPRMQRFDFLVRTRVLSEKELRDLQQKAPSPTPASLHHLVWRAALEQLTAQVAASAAPHAMRARE